MAPPEAPQRRVDVELGVAVAVVLAVVAGPPQRALLGAAGAADGEEELERPVGPVRPVGEVPVVAGGDEPLAAPDHHDEGDHRLGGHAEDERADHRGDVHEQEGDGRLAVDLLVGPSVVGRPDLGKGKGGDGAVDLVVGRRRELGCVGH